MLNQIMNQMAKDQENHEDRMKILEQIANLMTSDNLSRDFAGTMKKAESLRARLNTVG